MKICDGFGSVYEKLERALQQILDGFGSNYEKLQRAL